jgi:hypothetical protein
MSTNNIQYVVVFFAKILYMPSLTMSNRYTTNIFYDYKYKYFNHYVRRLDISKYIQN